MCSIVAIIMLIGPRANIILWWIFNDSRWSQTFDTFLLPVLGFIFLPWTTLAYVLVFPDGIHGLDVALLILAFLGDIGAYGGGYRNRDRIGSR